MCFFCFGSIHKPEIREEERGARVPWNSPLSGTYLLVILLFLVMEGGGKFIPKAKPKLNFRTREVKTNCKTIIQLS